ncbi:MAG: glycerophosphodiester phosphodiesterase [Actinobacteria bacterium]|nr:glycerophosphodiester phosphodiesterase [Actinomycetota bacterium]
MRPYLTHEHPIRFAHRGGRGLWPQNTMAAFQGSVDLGYRYIETDVHLSADGRVVMFHDDHLDGLTDGAGKVWDHGWSHLATLDAAYHFDPAAGCPLRGTGIGIPLFEEAVTTFPNLLWNIDLKQPAIEQAVADEVARLGLEDRVLIGSFHDHRIGVFRKITGGRVATSAGPRETAVALAAALAGRALGGRADAYQVPERAGPLKAAGRRFVDAAHRAGKQVHVWTVNEQAAMHRLLDRGVDGIVTDRPDLLAEVVREREGR